jgi:hypothetical protein
MRLRERPRRSRDKTHAAAPASAASD